MTFAETSSAESFLGQREHTIEGKRVEAKNAVPKSELAGGGGGGYGGGGSRASPTKIFVGGTVRSLNRRSLCADILQDYICQYDMAALCVGRLDRRGHQGLFRTVWGDIGCSGEDAAILGWEVEVNCPRGTLRTSTCMVIGRASSRWPEPWFWLCHLF